MLSLIISTTSSSLATEAMVERRKFSFCSFLNSSSVSGLLISVSVILLDISMAEESRDSFSLKKSKIRMGGMMPIRLLTMLMMNSLPEK